VRSVASNCSGPRTLLRASSATPCARRRASARAIAGGGGGGISGREAAHPAAMVPGPTQGSGSPPYGQSGAVPLAAARDRAAEQAPRESAAAEHAAGAGPGSAGTPQVCFFPPLPCHLPLPMLPDRLGSAGAVACNHQHPSPNRALLPPARPPSSPY